MEEMNEFLACVEIPTVQNDLGNVAKVNPRQQICKVEDETIHLSEIF